MSKEREILKKILMLYREDKSCMNWGTANEIQELLAQPKQPMTGEEISQSLRTDHDATNIQSYVAGVELAERYHGIGVDDE